MKFMVSINLGNDAMQDGFDIAAALRKIADQIQSYNTEDLDASASDSANMRIRDFNGNTVGFWKIAND
jgi:hypothetical protein